MGGETRFVWKVVNGQAYGQVRWVLVIRLGTVGETANGSRRESGKTVSPLIEQHLPSGSNSVESGSS